MVGGQVMENINVMCNCRQKENCDITDCPFIDQLDGYAHGTCNLKETLNPEYGQMINITLLSIDKEPEA